MGKGRLAVVAALAAAFALVPGAAAGPRGFSLTLDWTPNPDHVGIYMARDAGLFARAGVPTDGSWIVKPYEEEPKAEF